MRGGLFICAIVITSAACDSKDVAVGANSEPSVGVLSASAAASTASSAVAAAPEPAVYATRKLGEGKDPDGRWTGGFEIERRAGGVGLGFSEAFQVCADGGKALCSEAQWSRACEADPALGALETWTLSYERGGKFISRGGAEGCSGRRAVAREEKSPQRVAVCCSRAVAVESTNTNLAFLRSAAKKNLDYEQVLHRRDRTGVADAYDTDTIFLGKTLSRQAIMREFDLDLKRFPDQWTVIDRCKVSLGKDDAGDTTLISDCRTVFRRGGQPYGAMVRFVRGGPETKIRQVGFEAAKPAQGSAEPATSNGPTPSTGPAPSGEMKEGFGFLLPAEE